MVLILVSMDRRGPYLYTSSKYYGYQAFRIENPGRGLQQLMYSTIFVCTTPTVRSQSPSSSALRAAIGSHLLKTEDNSLGRVTKNTSGGQELRTK